MQCQYCGLDVPEGEMQSHLQTAHVQQAASGRPVERTRADMRGGDRGFFGSLFNLSFEHFITPKLIKVIFVLSVVLAAIWALVLVGVAFQASDTAGILTLIIGAPLFFLFSVIYVRVLLELAIVLFKIEQHTGNLER